MSTKNLYYMTVLEKVLDFVTGNLSVSEKKELKRYDNIKFEDANKELKKESQKPRLEKTT